MATIGAQNTNITRGGYQGRSRTINGLQLWERPVTAISDTDTLGINEIGLQSIQRAAFEPDDAGDDVNVVVTDGSTITFNTGTVGPHSGTVLIWHRGY